MGTLPQFKILTEHVCFSHRAKTLGKGMNPTIPSSALGQYLGRLGSLTSVWQPVLEKENSAFKTIKLDYF